MEKCLVITNKNSGNSVSYSNAELCEIIEKQYEFISTDIDADYLSALKENDCNAIAVVGGDGTLNSVLNKIKNKSLRVYYIPKGTLNEKAKTAKKFNSTKNFVIGKVNGRIFTYVAAAGSFTPIGYNTMTKTKKRFKLLAYFFQALKEYKVYSIPLDLDVDGEDLGDNYSLIMLLKSPRCFIFKFNKLYSPTSKEGHILLIKSPGKNNFINKIKIFPPLFRAFFIGFKKEVRTKNLKFISFKNISMNIKEDTDFAFDGEKRTLSGDVKVVMTPLRPDLTVCHPKSIKGQKNK